MKKTLSYLILLCLLFALPATLAAEQTKEQELKEVMIQKSDRFFSILKEYANDNNLRQQKILDEVTPLFDFDLMARLALNKTIWKSISQEERSAFSHLFIERVKDSYLSKLDLFADFKVNIEDSVRVKENRIEVTALLKTKADTKKLVYKFYRTQENTWLIYDVSVVGVSFLQSYRSQFSSFLKEHSFKELLEELKNNKLKDDDIAV